LQIVPVPTGNRSHDFRQSSTATLQPSGARR
jgi:hypothetical protein